jgi:ArsR family transcriptional regulator
LTWLGAGSYIYIFNYSQGRWTRLAEQDFVKGHKFDWEAEILKVLGHPVRLKIVAGLMSQSCNVKKIWECLDLPQATVSQHLALLKNKGIIVGRRDGVEVYYQVVSGQAQAVVNAMLGSPSCG